MNIRNLWTEIEAVPITSSMYEIFDRFRSHREWPVLPVVDEQRRVLGVVREYELREFAYAQFGRDLIKRCTLQDFLRPTLVLPANVPKKELLDSSARNPNPDGIVLTDGGTYRAILLSHAVLRLFEQQHLETEVRLGQAEKMEAIGTLAGGIAHDLNNILTPILGYAELMSLLQKRGDPIDQEVIDQIVISAIRAREIVKQILAFSRHQKSERCPLSLGRLIKETLPLVRSSLPATIDIEMRLNAEEDTVMMNPDEMNRVIVNLCTNAYHAMRERGGRLLIALNHHRGAVLGWSMHDEFLLGNYLRLSITDTGTGIDTAILPRIFEPFFTTKMQGEGTGLGLSIIHGIVSRYKGLISVQSVLGQGTTFHIYLPLVTPDGSNTATPPLPAVQDKAMTGGKKIRVLFVDDEFAVTRLASMILPEYGICVDVENDSHKALAVFRERIADYDLLVTDQTMPGLTGIDLAREVLQLRPGLPVMLCTGYSESASPEQAREVGVCEYVIKPPDFQKMAASIRKWVSDRAVIKS